MRGCLFTIVLAVAVLAFVVVVGLPAAAAGIFTAGVSAAGLKADDTVVTVTSDPPTDLLGLHADRVRLRATHATFRGLEIGSLDVSFRDVALVDRTARVVDGRLSEVTVPDVGGRAMTLAAITLAGGGETVTATTTIAGAAAERLLADAIAAKVGARPTAVTLAAPNAVTVKLLVTVHATLAVTGAGDLVARLTDGPDIGLTVVLLHGGTDLPIRLTSVRVTDSGDLRLAGELSVGLLG
jgi:hypothetical protein